MSFIIRPIRSSSSIPVVGISAGSAGSRCRNASSASCVIAPSAIRFSPSRPPLLACLSIALDMSSRVTTLPRTSKSPNRNRVAMTSSWNRLARSSSGGGVARQYSTNEAGVNGNLDGCSAQTSQAAPTGVVQGSTVAIRLVNGGLKPRPLPRPWTATAFDCHGLRLHTASFRQSASSNSPGWTMMAGMLPHSSSLQGDNREI